MTENVVGYRFGHRGKPIEGSAQWWPVYDRPPPSYGPLVVGGSCPVDMHIGRVSGGWSCVPNNAALGDAVDDAFDEFADEFAIAMLKRAAILVGAVALVIGGGFYIDHLRKKRKSR